MKHSLLRLGCLRLPITGPDAILSPPCGVQAVRTANSFSLLAAGTQGAALRQTTPYR